MRGASRGSSLGFTNHSNRRVQAHHGGDSVAKVASPSPHRHAGASIYRFDAMGGPRLFKNLCL